MKAKYNITEVLQGVDIPVYTWGTVTEDSCVMVGTTKMTVTNTAVIWGTAVGSIVLLLWRQGTVEVIEKSQSSKCVEVSVTVGGGGRVIWAEENSKELSGCIVYPFICTMRFYMPERFIGSLLGDNFGLFVPETSVVSIVHVRFPVNRRAALVGMSNFNKVSLLGGRLMRSPEFIDTQSENLYLVSGERLQNSGSVAWLRQFECVAEGGKLFIPGTDIEVCVEEPQDGVTYLVSVPDQLLDVKEPISYFPYYMDCTPMYSVVENNGSEGYSESQFIGELSDLSKDAEGIKELFPKMCALREMMPPTVRTDGNTIARVIELACAYVGIRV